MRKGYFYSLFFALLSGASVAAIAAPEAKAVESSMVTEAATRANTYKVDLNGADAQTDRKSVV